MTTTNNNGWEKEFDDKFPKHLPHTEKCNHNGTPAFCPVKGFIHSLLSRQKQELEEHHATDCANHEKKWRGELKEGIKFLKVPEAIFPHRPYSDLEKKIAHNNALSKVESLIDNIK